MDRLQVSRTEQDGKVTYEASERVELPTWTAGARLRVVGKPQPRVEGMEKVTGRARYAYDQRLPRQLYAAVLRSPHPHARVIHIDTSRAESLPGVAAVLSSANCPPVQWYQEGSQLFDSTLRFIGDEVAAVAADTEQIALDALRLIQVEYEQLPFVAALDDALQPDAPPVHPSGNRVREPEVYERGDLSGGFAAADVIIEQTYRTQTALHNCLEPHGCTASWEADQLTLWESTQAIWEVREQLARALGLPAHRVRVIKQYMGGGFGSKQVAWKPSAIAALLSRQAGQPVQLLHDRESENLAAGNRSPTRQRLRLGATRDGRLTAIEARIELAQGAYQPGGEVAAVDGIYQTLYRCANVRTELTGYYTNTGPAVAFRAPGFVEGAFALESAMDELARGLAIDPIALRERNYTTDEQQASKPYTSPQALRECWTQAAEAFGWQTYQRPVATGSKRRGIGFAAHNWIGGAGQPPGYAWVKLNSDGTADVVTGSQDIGTGSRTGLSQIAAEELGVSMRDVRLYMGDTGVGPYAPVSSGSATQATMGPAIRSAASEVKRQLLEAAAVMLEVRPDDVRIEDGDIFVAGAPTRHIRVAEVAGRIAPHMIQGQGARSPNPTDKAVRTFGAQCVEVEVDVESGQVDVLRVVASHDCGRIVNPTMVESQVIGAVTQGLGFGLMEERVIDPRYGVVLNPNLEHYEVPTVLDIPLIEHAAHDVPDTEANPTGAKGIGEPPLIPTAPAIANAIFDAVGVRVREAPITRQRLLEALRAGV
ncbi:MAG: xanthine dehydrogenase family protein molybdopterin-binding subunit [Chloroflexi bacterium]|nr:xanthine dehydrogenase family protein molybdopterin-binding subunit [Chloroflexota bacterium]